MGLQDLLEYQKTDAQLRKIEQEIGTSEERKKYMQAKKFVDAAMEKIDSQDKRAAELAKMRDELETRCEDFAKQIEEYSDLEEMVEGGGDLGFYKKNALALLDRIRSVKAEIDKIAKESTAVFEEFKTLRDQVGKKQAEREEYKGKFDELKGKYANEVKEIKTRLDALSAKFKPEILEKYKAKRKEGIFPIFVPLKDGRCVCGMDLSLAQQGKLSGGGVIECEHCRRFIYNT